MNKLGDCSKCESPMASGRQWAKQTPEQRAEMLAAGWSWHKGRDMCNRCYLAWTRNESRVDGQGRRDEVPPEVVAEEWAFLANPWRTDFDNARDLGPRLGMTPGSLVRAVQRLRDEGVLEQARENVA